MTSGRTEQKTWNAKRPPTVGNTFVHLRVVASPPAGSCCAVVGSVTARADQNRNVHTCLHWRGSGAGTGAVAGVFLYAGRVRVTPATPATPVMTPA